MKELYLDRPAVILARRLHEGQRYGAQPYWDHIEEVITLLIEWGYTGGEWIDAAALHDAVEDTPLTVNEIRELFGDNVAKRVASVTLGGTTNSDFVKMIEGLEVYPDGAIIKTADRIRNIEKCLQGRNVGKGKKYLRQKDKFNYTVLRWLTPDIADRLLAASSALEEMSKPDYDWSTHPY